MVIAKVETFHKELQEWHKTLQFFEEETRAFERQLEEVVNKNTNKEVLIETEHFQNQFILQKEQFQLLKHDIHEQETKITEVIQKQNPLINVPVTEKQQLLSGRVQQTETIFTETKVTFKQFLSKVL